MVQSATAFSSHQYINWNRYSSYRCIEPNLIDFSQSCISGTPPVRRRSTDSGTCPTPMPTSSSSSSTSSTQRHSVRFATLVCLAVSKCRVNTHNRGKYHCTADLLFDWFRFDQTGKTVVHATQAKQPNPNK